MILKKHQRLPAWIIKQGKKREKIQKLKNLIREKGLHTVCLSARCPNWEECFSCSTLTFLILGNVCTRNCSFCGINKGIPVPVNPQEPEEIARLTEQLGLAHLVITSVTRDDLEDGGAGQFYLTLKFLRERKKKNIFLEVLTSDFNGSYSALDSILQEPPNVYAHNLETVPRLYKQIRKGADYRRSLNLLSQVKILNREVLTKSGIMLGLGETKEEVHKVMKDLREAECDLLTLGQYLRPQRQAFPVAEYIHPDLFKEYKEYGDKLGFKSVLSGPLVRSSYRGAVRV